MRKFKFLLIPIFVILIFIFLSKESKKQNIILEPSLLSKEYSIALLKSLEELKVKEIKLNQKIKISQVGSFADENSPYYLILEDYQVGEKLDLPIGNFEARSNSKIVYLKFKVFKVDKESKDWLIVDVINYRIIGRACSKNEKICYEFQDRQEPEIGSKKDVQERTYYLIAAVPASEKIDTIVLSHLSFSGGGITLGSIQTNDLPLAKFTP